MKPTERVSRCRYRKFGCHTVAQVLAVVVGLVVVVVVVVVVVDDDVHAVHVDSAGAATAAPTRTAAATKDFILIDLGLLVRMERKTRVGKLISW